MAHTCWLLRCLLPTDPSNHFSLVVHVLRTQQHSCIRCICNTLLTSTTCARSTQSTYKAASASDGDNATGLVIASCGDAVCLQGTASELRRDRCSCDARLGECQSRGQDAGLSGAPLPPVHMSASLLGRRHPTRTNEAPGPILMPSSSPFIKSIRIQCMKIPFFCSFVIPFLYFFDKQKG